MVPLFYGRGRSLRNHVDDAYITYRFAIQLARGHGLVFNVGERIDAASSFLYAILLAGLYRIGLHDLEVVAVAIGALSAGAIAAIVFETVQQLTRRTWLATAVAVLAGANGLISGWAASGMESVFYAFLVTLLVSRSFFRRRETWGTAVVLALVILTRVEGLIVAFAWASMHCIRILREGSPRNTSSNRFFLLHGGLAAVTVLTFFSLKYSYYGTLLPHTYHLKRLLRVYGSNPSDLLQNWERVAAMAVFLAFVGAIVLVRQPSNSAIFGALIFLLLTGISCAVGPTAGWARYSIQALPTVMILAGVALDYLLKKSAPISILLLFGVVVQTVSSCAYMANNLRSFSSHQDCRRKVGDYMNDHLDHSAVILSTDIGGIGYVAMDFSFIDTVGLTSIDVFKAYQDGRSLDSVFERRLPKFAADSWWPLPGKSGRGEYKAHDKVARAGRMVARAIPPTHYAADLQDLGVQYKCLEAFAVGPIGRP